MEETVGLLGDLTYLAKKYNLQVLVPKDDKKKISIVTINLKEQEIKFD